MIKQIIRYIMAILLTISIIIFTFVSRISSTILSENYVLSKLEETNYYEKVYEDVKSNFENYIYQSGLDETVLEDVVSIEKVKQDTNFIIRNIYNGLLETIDSQPIKDKLKQNIAKATEGMNLNITQEQAIETLVETISGEYTTTILHFGFEKNINTGYQSLVKYVTLAKRIALVAMVVCIFIIVAVSTRRIYRIFVFISMSLVASGTFLVVVNQVITSKIDIQAISILNTAISVALRNIFSELLGSMFAYGCGFIVVGCITIIVANLIHNIRKYNQKNHTKEEA